LVGLTEDDDASKGLSDDADASEGLTQMLMSPLALIPLLKSEINLNCSGEGDAGTKISLSQAFYTPRFLNTSVPLGQIRLWGMISDISGTSKPP